MEVLDKIKKIKRNRLEPGELFLIQDFEGVNKSEQTFYANQVFWYKHGLVYFKLELDSQTLCFNETIWDMLINYYFLKPDEIYPLIHKMVKKYFNIDAYHVMRTTFY